MEEKEIKEFTLPALLLVTGICFLLFDLFLRITQSAGNKLFLCIGIITLSCGVVITASVLINYANKAKSKITP